MPEKIQRTRFSMVKARHKATFEKALSEGKVDEKLVKFCKFIALTKNFFTSSGCSGRILLLELPKNESKREANFHRKWHRSVSFKEVFDALKEKTNGTVWFKLEPFILHLGTDTLKNAKKILRVMKDSGVKRGGIIVAVKGKFLVELIGTQEISVPVKKNDKLLVGEEFLKKLVEIANTKLKKNYRMLERFEKNCKDKLN